MAISCVIGNSFRGATWVSAHNGGGVGWGKVINTGFGMVLDGTDRANECVERMIPWDVGIGLARRSWAGNSGARTAIEWAMKANPQLAVTIPNIADQELVKRALKQNYT